MKKIIIISLLAIVAITVTVLYLNRKRTLIYLDPMKAVPADAAFIIEAERPAVSIPQFIAKMKSRNLSQIPWLAAVAQQFQWADSVVSGNAEMSTIYRQKSLVISAHPVSASNFDYLFLINVPRGWTAQNLKDFIESRWQNPFSIRVYEDVAIYESQSGDNRLAFAFNKSVGIFSSASLLVEEAIHQLNHGSSVTQKNDFRRVHISSEGKPSVNIYQGYNALRDLTGNEGFQSAFFSMASGMANWSGYRVDSRSDYVLLKGRTSVNDTAGLLAVATAQKPLALRACDIAPSSTALLFEYAYAPKKINQPDLHPEALALFITEPAGQDIDNNLYICVKSKKVADAFAQLNKYRKKLSSDIAELRYKSHNISFLPDNSMLPKVFDYTLAGRGCYFTSIHDFIVFASQPAPLKILIDDYEGGKVLAKDSLYQQERASLSDLSNARFYCNPSRSSEFFRIGQSNSFFNIFGQATAIHLQWIAGPRGLPETNSLINFHNRVLSEPVLLCSVQLDTVLACTPAILEQQRKGSDKSLLYIIAQDENHVLYKIDESGKVIWKKTIGEPVMGAINIVDVYHDGNKQLLFNTTDKLYLLNTEGNPLGNFPIRLPAKASNSLALLSTPSGYNLYIACINGYVYGYNASGKPLPDWKYLHLEAPATKKISIFSGAGKTYLLIQKDENNILVLDPRGKEILSFKDRFSVGKNSDITLLADSGQKQSWATTDVEGRLIRFNSEGEVSSNYFEKFSSPHSFNLDSENIIFADASGMGCYSISTGKLKWKISLPDLTPATLQSIQFPPGDFYYICASSDDYLYSLNNNGEMRRGFPLKGGLYPLSSNNGLIVTGTTDGLLNFYRLK